MKVIKKNIIIFSIVITIILIVTGVILINHLNNIWIWTGYIILWTLVMINVLKNLQLNWWVWVLIISVIFLFGITLLHYFGPSYDY